MSAPRAATSLYCPRCGKRLVQKASGWACAGGHEFSERAGEMLLERFATSFDLARMPAFPPQTGRWFCPACCIPVGSNHICPECGGSLRGALMYLLQQPIESSQMGPAQRSLLDPGRDVPHRGGMLSRSGLLLVLAISACGSHASGIPADADLDMQASDFNCILEWPAAHAYRITNKLGYVAQSLAVANAPDGGTFPVGTVIQLIPNEAMVKRKIGWNPATQDWEFFALQPEADGGTIIQQRGGAEVVNHFGGGSCYACHSAAAPQWDLICSTDHGCTPLPFGPSVISQLQESDPRCN